jgi:hypothetical protein
MAICPKNGVRLASRDLGVLIQERAHLQAHVSQRCAEPVCLAWRVYPRFWSIARCIPRVWTASRMALVAPRGHFPSCLSQEDRFAFTSTGRQRHA